MPGAPPSPLRWSAAWPPAARARMRAPRHWPPSLRRCWWAAARPGWWASARTRTALPTLAWSPRLSGLAPRSVRRVGWPARSPVKKIQTARAARNAKKSPRSLAACPTSSACADPGRDSEVADLLLDGQPQKAEIEGGGAESAAWNHELNRCDGSARHKRATQTTPALRVELGEGNRNGSRASRRRQSGTPIVIAVIEL